MQASVIIPCYNYGEYLERAVDSVRAQTQPPSELILVDDGSTDDSLAVMRRLAGAKSAFPCRVIQQPNRGVVEARNRGAAESSGDCLLFLDPDDRLCPEMIAKTTRALAGNPKAAVAYTYAAFHYDGIPPQPGGPTEGEIAAVREFSFSHLLENNFVFMSSLIRRAAFTEAGGFDARIRWAEDWELWIDICKRGWTAVLVPEPLFVYTLHAGSRRGVGESESFEAMAEIQAIHAELFDPARREWLLVAAGGGRVRQCQDEYLEMIAATARAGEDAAKDRAAEAAASHVRCQRLLDEWRQIASEARDSRVRELAAPLVEDFQERLDALRKMADSPIGHGSSGGPRRNAERKIALASQDLLRLGEELGELDRSPDPTTKRL